MDTACCYGLYNVQCMHSHGAKQRMPSSAPSRARLHSSSCKPLKVSRTAALCFSDSCRGKATVTVTYRSPCRSGCSKSGMPSPGNTIRCPGTVTPVAATRTRCPSRWSTCAAPAPGVTRRGSHLSRSNTCLARAAPYAAHRQRAPGRSLAVPCSVMQHAYAAGRAACALQHFHCMAPDMAEMHCLKNNVPLALVLARIRAQRRHVPCGRLRGHAEGAFRDRRAPLAGAPRASVAKPTSASTSEMVRLCRRSAPARSKRACGSVRSTNLRSPGSPSSSGPPSSKNTTSCAPQERHRHRTF